MRLILILLTVLIPGLAYAQVLHLAVDKDSAHQYYTVEFDSAIYGPALPIEVKADMVVVLEVQSLITVGSTHIIRIKASNHWGDESKWSNPFEFVRVQDGTVYVRSQVVPPVGLRLILN